MATDHAPRPRPRPRPGLGATDRLRAAPHARRRHRRRRRRPDRGGQPRGRVHVRLPARSARRRPRRRPRPRSAPGRPRRRSAPATSPIPPGGPWAPGPSCGPRRLDRTEFPADISLAPLGAPEQPLTLAVVRDLHGSALGMGGGRVAGGHRVVVGGRHRVDGPRRAPSPPGTPVPNGSSGTAPTRSVANPWRAWSPTICAPTSRSRWHGCAAGCTSPRATPCASTRTGARSRWPRRSRSFGNPTGASTGISAVLRDITAREAGRTRASPPPGRRAAARALARVDLRSQAVDARRRRARPVAGPDREASVGAVRCRRHHGERGRPRTTTPCWR